MSTAGWHMKMLVFAIIGLVAGGCSPQGKGVFYNSLQTAITVTITSSRKPTHSVSAVIPPGEASVFMGLRAVDQVTIRVDESQTNFTRTLHVGDPEHRYYAPGEPEVHFLVSSGEVYRVPRTLRKRWKDHEADIQVPAGRLPPP